MRLSVCIALAGALLATLVIASPGQAAFPGTNGKISFNSDRTEPFAGIYATNPDGSGAARVGVNPTQDYSGRWSGDGKRIVFVSAVGGDNEIWVMDANGTEPGTVHLQQHGRGHAVMVTGRQEDPVHGHP